MGTRFRPARAISEEHAAIRAIGNWIRKLLDRPPTEHAVDDLAGMLRAFRDPLIRHFRFEEEGDFLGRADDANPGVQRRIRILLEEHETFVARLDRILAGLKAAHGAAGLPRALEGAVRELLEDLARHEAVENQLFQEAAYEEFGGGD